MSALVLQICPSCAGRLESDGLCLVCLLNEGIESDHGSTANEAAVARGFSLPCEFAGYKLVREIASGGMGIVYEAEDLKLRRVVALKVIRNVLFATREEASRFKAETQAIAQLDHPNIVPIYESGEVDGLPYYTMRLAEGGSLADRLKRRGVLPDREAAALMSRIARSVQHAHEHGVLHRDLKPANILLDVAGRPMLSDFGLAKLLDAEYHLTRTQAHVGTPHYMSPEQAAGRAKEITTASDVWALGVMLYQMLTAKLPFQGGSAVEVMRRITHEEPEISSTGKLISRSRVGQVETKPEESALKQITHIQRDLATLILRCLEKQPSRRLPNAGFLADELERFLNGEPIHSRAVGSFERVVKLALRNKAAAVAILGTSVSLIAGTVVSVWQANTARAAAAAAIRQRDNAESVSDIVLQTVNELSGRETHLRLDAEGVRRQLLKRINEFKGDLERKADLLNGIDLIQAGDETVRIFESVLEELRQQVGDDDPRLWRLRYNLAARRAYSVSRAESIQELRTVHAWQRKHQGLDDWDTINTQVTLCDHLILSGEKEAQEAVGLMRELLQTVTSHAEPSASFLVRCRFTLASALFRSGRREEALAMGRENCRLAVLELGDEQLRTAFTFGRHAKNCREAGLMDEAASTGRRALEIYWCGVGPAQEDAAAFLRWLSETLLEMGDREGRITLMRDAVRECDHQLGPVHGMTLFRVEALMVALENMQRQAEAERLGAEWLTRARGRDGTLPVAALEMLRQHAYTLRLLARHAEAEAELRELVAMMDEHRPGDLKRFSDLSNLAQTLIKQKRVTEAVPLLQQVVRAFEERGAENSKLTETTLPLAQRRLREALEAQ
ncbi:MAG: serine/threonine-protein kinase [Prosthecobacter sp.]